MRELTDELPPDPGHASPGEAPSRVAQVFTRTSSDPRVIVADGYGLRITTRGGHLFIEDGIGRHRRTRKIPRINAKSSDGIARLVILADTGYVSLEALRWCKELDIAVMQLDRQGDILMVSPGQYGDARLRRSQVMAGPGMPLAKTGTAIVRDLLVAKLTGQAETLSTCLKSASDLAQPMFARHLSNMSVCDDMNKMISIEGRAGLDFWHCWIGNVFVPFHPAELPNVPVHWYQFNGRSEVAGANRHSINPVNSMLNYSYAICLAEAIHACHITGLDPGFGLGHGEQNSKPGMALDLMEPLRPVADRVVLGMLDTGLGVPYGNDGRPAYLSVKVFAELSDGSCRLVSPLTHLLAEQVSMAVAPVASQHAERIARQLSHAASVGNLMQSVKRATSDVRLQPRQPLRNSVRIHALEPTLTAIEMVPDALWSVVQGFIPSEPVVRTHKPNPRCDNRAVLAGIIAHEVYGCSWSGIPLGLGVDRKTCRRRLDEWQLAGAWPLILAEISKPGVSQAM